MNYRIVFKIIGKILAVEAALLIFPLITSFIYKEGSYLSYIIPIALLLCLSFFLTRIKIKRKNFYAKEGFAIVGLSWILLSIFGALPFIISNTLPNFFEAFFETVSGFTTTGASVIQDIEIVLKSILLWRSIIIWVGGMGVLVFMIAILPHTDARSMYLVKAESPGPQVGKLVSKLKFTAQILYLIYITLTIILFIFLVIKIPVFDSICHALASAGTGGFGIYNSSIAAYNSLYVEVVLTIFLILFGINFSIFYLILVGNVKQVFKSEELRTYLGIIIISMVLISINTISIYGNFFNALRYSSFQVSSIISTTGFSTVDYNTWPSLSKWIIVILMFIGGCAGSTGGGIKVSRIILYFKTIVKEIKYSIHPKQISIITFEEKVVDESTLKGVSSFFATYMFVLIISILLISIDGFDLLTNFTAALSSISNIGPGLEMVGPVGNYHAFSSFSKLVLSITMLIGRLELFPILVLFSPKLWINN